MTQPLALVIDDEPDICELLTLTLGRMDIRTQTAMDVAGRLGFTQINIATVNDEASE